MKESTEIVQKVGNPKKKSGSNEIQIKVSREKLRVIAYLREILEFYPE